MPSHIRPILISALAAATLAGCGGTDLEFESEIETSDLPAVEGEYPADADRICAGVTEGFEQAQAEVPRSFEQAEELMLALSELATEGQAALAAITPPAESADAYASYLEGRAEVVELIDRGLAAAREEDGEAYQQAREEVGVDARERRRLAREAGLRECAAGERG